MRLSRHAREQALAKGFPLDDVIAAAEHPSLRYPSRSHPGQVRCVRGDLCVVVDPAMHLVITVYTHLTRTPLRADQLEVTA